MNLLTVSAEYEPTAGNPEHGNGSTFTPSEVAYLSHVLDEARVNAPDVFRYRIIDRLHDVLNGKVG